MTGSRTSGPQVAVAGIALDADGRVLLIQRGTPPGVGLWTVPGGRVELGETMREACAREMREETGLDVEVVGVVDAVDRIERDAGEIAYHYVIVDFLVTVTGGEARAADDAADVRWVGAEDLAGLALTDGLLPVLDAARRLAAAGG